MTDWIEHTTDTCPVDPDTVVEVRSAAGNEVGPSPAVCFWWTVSGPSRITHYRIVTPAKPPEPEEPFAPWDSWPKRSSEVLPSEPDLITLRLECMKLAMDLAEKTTARISHTDDLKKLADVLLHYVLNGSETARD